jgi:hypothetical protein
MHAAALSQHGEDRVVDVAERIRVAEAQNVLHPVHAQVAFKVRKHAGRYSGRISPRQSARGGALAGVGDHRPAGIRDAHVAGADQTLGKVDRPDPA